MDKIIKKYNKYSYFPLSMNHLLINQSIISNQSHPVCNKKFELLKPVELSLSGGQQ
jgi:hypothetical protein